MGEDCGNSGFRVWDAGGIFEEKRVGAANSIIFVATNICRAASYQHVGDFARKAAEF
jgi:hypothetical protein